jgi:hypothetical protein
VIIYHQGFAPKFAWHDGKQLVVHGVQDLADVPRLVT